MHAPRFDGLQPASATASLTKMRNRSRGGTAERTLRSQLWRLGLRFRVNDARLPGKPDIVFPGARMVVFCDGDFWHGRDWKVRKGKLLRGHNAVYWVAKIEANMKRDLRKTRELTEDGWTVLRYWESDVLEDAMGIAALIARRVSRRTNPRLSASARSS